MAEEIPPAGIVAPVVPPVAVTPPTPPPADDQNPPWLAGRLERDRRVLLESLGITDPTKAKEAIAAAKKAEDDAKTAAQRLGETTKTLEGEKARADRYETTVKAHATRAIGLLTAEQQTAVRAIAPDTDPAAQLNAIDALAPTWVKPAAPATTPPAVTPPATPPATTAPAAGSAPAPGGTTTPPDHKAVYKDLEKRNPVAAANYLSRYQRDIYPDS